MRRRPRADRSDTQDAHEQQPHRRSHAERERGRDGRRQRRQTGESSTDSSGPERRAARQARGPADQPTSRGRHRAVRFPSGRRSTCGSRRELSSATAQVEQRFEATTVADLYRGDDVLIPAGSAVRGVVSRSTKTTRTERKGSLTVAFDQITVHGRDYPMRGTVTQALESEGIKGEAGEDRRRRRRRRDHRRHHRRGQGRAAGRADRRRRHDRGDRRQGRHAAGRNDSPRAARYTARDPIALTPISSSRQFSAPADDWQLGAVLASAGARLDCLLDVALVWAPDRNHASNCDGGM